MNDEPFDCMGRVNLPPPSAEALEAAAQDVLGPGADEALLADGTKLFRGDGAPGAIFIQGPGEGVGEILGSAPRELQDQLMDEALKVRASKVEVERMDYIDPAKNSMIKLGDD